MQSELEPYIKLYVDKERAHQKAWTALEDNGKAFREADVGHISYYAISHRHGEIFQAWVDADSALKAAARELHRKAADLAHLPLDHPLRAHLA